MPAASFVPLHCKSHGSLGLGTVGIPALVQAAGRLGYRRLALTDLENIYGQVPFHAACRAAGLQAVSGVELRTGFSPGRSFGSREGRAVLLAADALAFASLCRIVTERRRSLAPTAEPEDLGELAAGAFLLTDDPQLLAAWVHRYGPERVRALVVRPARGGRERELIDGARRLGVALVADLDATLLDGSGAALQRLASAVHLHCPLDRLPATLADEARVLLDPRATEALFADLPEAVRATQALGEACSLDLLSLPSAAPPDAPERHARLERRCRERLRELEARQVLRGRGYLERLEAELQMIERLGLSELFTSVSALAEHARQQAVPISARGSAVSSLVGHLLGISPIDPVEHGLYFERFASDTRRSPPDIDLDVASRQRDALIAWFMAWRGPERTARVGSLQTFQARSAHREGLKAMGARPEEIERFLRQFPPQELCDGGPPTLPSHELPVRFRGALRLIGGLVGLPRHLALHPGGVVLAHAPLAGAVPLERGASGLDVCQLDAASLAAQGYTKVDLLGSHVLDEIDTALALCRQRGSARDDIPSNDAPTFARIARGDTIGCFQLETPAMRAVLARLPIRGLEDLTHALAIVRPGPASGREKQLFLARARGEAREPELHARLRGRLRGTHGTLLYEEDILFVLSELAGLPLATADALRVRLQERGDDPSWAERARRRFLERTEAHGVDSGTAEAAWANVLRFVRYSFNKAHAVSQALLGYRVAFLACHAPLELGCALLDHHGGLYPRRVIAADLARHGVRLWLPSIERSTLDCSITPARDGGEEGILLGLGLVKGLRAATRERLLACRRERPLADAADLLARLQPRARELRALVWSGACDGLLGLERDDHPWVHEAVLGALEHGDAAGLDAVIHTARELRPRQPALDVERYRALSRVQKELTYLDLHVSDHPMRILRSEADRLGCIPSHRLAQHVGSRVAFAGVVAATRRVPLAAADVTQFLTLEDEHGLVEARLAPSVYSRLHAVVSTPGPYLVGARVREQHGVLALAIEALRPFHERPGAARPPERTE